MWTDVLSIVLQAKNKVRVEDLSPVGIKFEEFWTMLKKLTLIYYDFLGAQTGYKNWAIIAKEARYSGNSLNWLEAKGQTY